MIKKLTEENLDSVVELHRQVLGYTVNSQIGTWFLKRLYAITMERAHCYVFIEENKVLGFISYCLNRDQFSQYVFANLSWKDRVKIAWALASHPRYVWILKEQHSFSKTLKDFSHPYILTLGVSPTEQGRGIGKKLLDVVKNEVQGNLGVDTEASNVGAIRFYEQNGFKRLLEGYHAVALIWSE